MRDCGDKWVTTFSENKTAEENALLIEGLEWPRGATFTGMALALADDELNFGRSDAPSVVIVITDGRPSLPKQTTKFADKLKQKARLMFVPAGPNVQSPKIQEAFQGWATTPWQENIVNVHNIEDL